MDRRSFLKVGSAAPVALLPTVYPGGLVRAPSFKALDRLEPRGSGGTSVSYLGKNPGTAIERVMMALSENVFARLNAACPHTLRLVEGVGVDRIGSVTAGGVCLDTQMHTSFNLPPGMSSERPPEWDYEVFIAVTNHWGIGPGISVPLEALTAKEAGPPNAAEILRRNTVNAMLVQPRGVSWTGTYVSSQTGLAMRGVGNYMLYSDNFEMRWDVLCG